MNVYTKYSPPIETNVPGIIYMPKYPVMDPTPLPPSRIFDDLYFIGTYFVGCLILQTTDGLIMIDSMNSRRDVEEIILPGMRSLGLDPGDLKKIIVSHGHFDHFGGAAALKEITGAQVLMNDIDVSFMHECSLKPKDWVVEYPDCIPIRDGDSVTLGDTTVHCYFTPGHTPGGMSFLFPVHDNGTRHLVSLWGGINPPADIEGCKTYIASAKAFLTEMIRMNADVEFSCHPFVDYSIDKIRKLSVRKDGEVNPLIIGTDGVSMFMNLVVFAAEGRLKELTNAII